MKSLLILFTGLFLTPLFLNAQEDPEIVVVDSLYREDQIYIGFTYNVLTNEPEGVDNRNFSGGIHFGFLRDMPINKRRNVAIAAGLGYSFNSYGHNLFVGKEESGEGVFIPLDGDLTYDKNKFVTHELELPVEFRWRTSTPESYRFWRVYGGIKFSYIFHFNSVFRQEGNTIRNSDIEELNRLQYTAFLNFGYNTFNFQVQYNINGFFNDDARIDNVPVDLSTIKLGLIFYIL
tara:strand:+ start:174855 stop:175553 length:699 start_codon:yes stop_codon:yes gene_type:complete